MPGGPKQGPRQSVILANLGEFVVLNFAMCSMNDLTVIFTAGCRTHFLSS